jgi:hypothetical protein
MNCELLGTKPVGGTNVQSLVPLNYLTTLPSWTTAKLGAYEGALPRPWALRSNPDRGRASEVTQLHRYTISTQGL